jgi:threonine dehydratase
MNPYNCNVIRTPLLPFYAINQSLTANIYLKPENLQPFGSYKVRGIESVFAHTPIEKLKNGVSAASAGNMGQAIACMAKNKNIPCTIYVPDRTPLVKKERIIALGAQLVTLPFPKLWEYITNPPLSNHESLFIHPVYTKPLLLGYEKIANEIVMDLPEVDAIVIPIGIGGLAIAITNCIKKLRPSIAIFTCEAETAAPFKAALKHGKPITIPLHPSFVDIGTPEILPAVFDILAPMVEDSEVVSIIDIQNAVKMLLNNNKLLCEGAAACSVAAAINIAKKTQYKNIVSILTGGNLSTDYFSLNF